MALKVMGLKMTTFKSKLEIIKDIICRKVNRCYTKERLYIILLESKKLLEECEN